MLAPTIKHLFQSDSLHNNARTRIHIIAISRQRGGAENVPLTEGITYLRLPPFRITETLIKSSTFFYGVNMIEDILVRAMDN